MKQRNIPLGRNIETGETVYLDPKTRKTGIHIIGSTGEGKSKFMEHLIRNDIINDNGLCLIDPHGSLYDSLIRWCETKRFFGRKKIILFNPSEEEWTFGFNPLRVSSPDLSFHVDAMVRACAKVWGGENPDRTPLLKRGLRMVFHALGEKKLSLSEAGYLANPLEAISRKYLTRDIKDPEIRNLWGYFNTLKPTQFYNEFSSSISRLMEFLSSPIIRDIIGQTEQTIDFRKIMDEGHIVLVNLAPKGKISYDNARTLGTLIVNDLYMNTLCRPAEASRPFYLYIDECARYINEDIGHILDEGRKFGLHLTLAHQFLWQLKKAGEDIYHSVMTDAKTKVIFGGLDAEEAEVLARQVFLNEIDLEEPKEILNKPVVVGYIKEWLRNYSHAKGSSTAHGKTVTKGLSDLQSLANSTTIIPDPSGGGRVITGSTINVGAGRFSGEGDTTVNADTEIDSEGASEASMPVLKVLPTQVFTLEEQIYKGMGLMVDQPEQQALIKFPKKRTQFALTPTINPGFARAERVQKSVNECYRLVDFIKSKSDVKNILEQRHLLLEQNAKEALTPSVEEPKTFRVPKKSKRPKD